MFQPLKYDDSRGRYPDRLGVSVPKGFRAYLRRAADVGQMPVAELIRQGVDRRAAEILSSSLNQQATL